jgi:hypothetical protein
MGTRSTYVRRIDALEASVIGFGRAVAGRHPGQRVGHHRAVSLAIDALGGSLAAEAADLARIGVVQDVEFHVRHIDRLLDGLAGDAHARPDVRAALDALDRTLVAFADRDAGRLDPIDHALQRVLERVERPLLRDRPVASAADARVRRVALHVLAVAAAVRLAVPTGAPPTPTPAPVA